MKVFKVCYHIDHPYIPDGICYRIAETASEAIQIVTESVNKTNFHPPISYRVIDVAAGELNTTRPY